MQEQDSLAPQPCSLLQLCRRSSLHGLPPLLAPGRSQQVKTALLAHSHYFNPRAASTATADCDFTTCCIHCTCIYNACLDLSVNAPLAIRCACVLAAAGNPNTTATLAFLENLRVQDGKGKY